MRPACGSASTSGSVRVGVARSDPSGLLATPVRDGAAGPAAAADLRRGSPRSSPRTEAVEVVVGPAAVTLRRARARRPRGARATPPRSPRRVAPVPVRLVDERLTTVAAARHAARQRGRRAAGSAPWSTRRPRWSSCRPPWTPSAAPGRRPARTCRPAGAADPAGRVNPGTGQGARTDEGPAPRELHLRRLRGRRCLLRGGVGRGGRGTGGGGADRGRRPGRSGTGREGPVDAPGAGAVRAVR